ncbi:uncharacterized protein G2W53_004376 [Senna tora]|uniref:Uncharacterized protein n=1 Tax=Senna tora TaxID=362788 RepID=A0A834XAQ4_9FABA|nr:uncharacterized protein G2W53_004376 [Senna tora]
MTLDTFQAITCPIRALNPLEFPYITGSDRFDSFVQQHV